MSNHVKLNWFGGHCRSAIEAELKRRIEDCLRLVYDRAKALLNVEGSMKEKDVEEAGAADPEFKKQFNKNRAVASVKGKLHSARLKQGKVRYKKLKSED